MGIDVVFDTSQAQNGDTTTIEMKNLTGFGDSFKPGTKITAADGTVIGEVSSKETTNSVGSRGEKVHSGLNVRKMVRLMKSV